MTVVIDIGCARYGGDYSIERLIEEFSPDVLYGFDPSGVLPDSVPAEAERVTSASHKFLMPGGEGIVLEQKAAWVFDGEIGYREDGLNSWVTDAVDAPKVPCFDLARFLRVTAFKHRGGIVLKMDCEGSEYELLRHLIATKTDKLLALAWIEWHEPDRGRAKIEEEIACEIQEWRW